MTDISVDAAGRREAARTDSGQFGTQSRTGPTDLANPFDRVRAARAEIVAGCLSGVHDSIKDAIPDVTGIKVVNNDEGDMYWQVKRPGSDQWQNLYDGDPDTGKPYLLADGSYLEDVIWEAGSGGGLEITKPNEFEDYAAGPPAETTFNYPASMRVDKYSGELEEAELDLEKMRVAYEPYESAAPAVPQKPATVSVAPDELSNGDTLVSTNGSRLVITGEVSPSNQIPGFMAVETDFGTIYLDSEQLVEIEGTTDA